MGRKILTQFNKGASEQVSYTHSANSLFHFMNQRKYIEDAIRKKVLYPRYFVEDIAYRELVDSNGNRYPEVAVLGLCFCDLPMTRITVDEEIETLSADTNEIQNKMSHADLYGEYALGFSKLWCENNGIRPVHYINPKTGHRKYLADSFAEFTGSKDISDAFGEYILDDICLGKPLRGQMERTESLDGKERKISFIKNFHDEQEWRYIPTDESCKLLSEKTRSTIRTIIANQSLLQIRHGEKDPLLNLSNQIAEADEKSTGLSFKRTDIKYIIVPEESAKNEMIVFLTKLYERRKNKTELYKLISCIHVLSDIKRDY